MRVKALMLLGRVKRNRVRVLKQLTKSEFEGLYSRVIGRGGFGIWSVSTDFDLDIAENSGFHDVDLSHIVDDNIKNWQGRLEHEEEMKKNQEVDVKSGNLFALEDTVNLWSAIEPEIVRCHGCVKGRFSD